jgi:hypothetical protein
MRAVALALLGLAATAPVAAQEAVKGFVPTTTLMLWNVWLDPR